MSLINWRLPVADKEVFWDTLKVYDDWKFQHNKVVGQYRVVSPDKYREAWGFSYAEVLQDFKRLSGYREIKREAAQHVTYNEQPVTTSTPTKLELYDELEKVSELYQKGILEEEEFQRERKTIMDKIRKLP